MGEEDREVEGRVGSVLEEEEEEEEEGEAQTDRDQEAETKKKTQSNTCHTFVRHDGPSVLVVLFLRAREFVSDGDMRDSRKTLPA